MITRQEFEAALDARRVKIWMRNGNLWDVRRNGQTKTWKTRPNEFRIPIKFGLKSCGAITENNLHKVEAEANPGSYLIIR